MFSSLFLILFYSCPPVCVFFYGVCVSDNVFSSPLLLLFFFSALFSILSVLLILMWRCVSFPRFLFTLLLSYFLSSPFFFFRSVWTFLFFFPLLIFSFLHFFSLYTFSPSSLRCLCFFYFCTMSVFPFYSKRVCVFFSLSLYFSSIFLYVWFTGLNVLWLVSTCAWIPSYFTSPARIFLFFPCSV